MLAPDQHLGAYRLIARIGAGGMGEVWKAEDTRLGRDVAIKILPPAVASEPEAIARMRREARTVAQLYHPNIATVHSFEEADGQTFIVMELVAGEPLSALIARHALGEADVCRIGRGVSEALAEAHEKGIVHRDIKPDNIIVNGSRVKVLDFGIAKKFGVETPTSSSPTAFVTQQGMILGTVHYMSPEQALGKSMDARTDIFSLGIVLYEAATGKLPFAGETITETITQIIRDEPEEPVRVNPSISPGLSAIIQRCLRKNRDERFATASELATALEVQQSKAPTDLFTNPNVAAIGVDTSKQPTVMTGSKVHTVNEAAPTKAMPTQPSTVRPQIVSAPRPAAPTVRTAPAKKSAWPWITAIVVIIAAAIIGAAALKNRPKPKEHEVVAAPSVAPQQQAVAAPAAPSTSTVSVTATPVVEEKTATTATSTTSTAPAEASETTQSAATTSASSAQPPSTADQLYEQGMSLLALGDSGEARRKFVEALQQDPQHAKSLFRTGEIALFNRNFDHAAEQFRKALVNASGLDPRERALSQLGLAIATDDRGRANLIAREIHQASPQDPDLRRMRQTFGQFFGRTGEEPRPRRRFRP